MMHSALKLLYLTILISMTSLITTEMILHSIEKHSVHPMYGTYQQKILGCHPWDSCKHDLGMKSH